MADHENGRFPQGSRLIAGAIVAAAMILAWGSHDKGPRYQIATSGNGFVRLDTDTGDMVACDQQSCRSIAKPSHTERFGPLKVVIGNSAADEQGPKQPQLPSNQP